MRPFCRRCPIDETWSSRVDFGFQSQHGSRSDDYGRVPRGDHWGHWTNNYGSDGYALFGTAPNNDVPGTFSPSGGQSVFDFSAQLSNGQTTLASGNNLIDISGVAFQAAAIPEPTTAVLLTSSFVLLGLLAAARRWSTIVRA
jgi:hypothetical protein